MEAILERLSKLDVASVSDAMDKLGIPCGLLGMHPVVPGKHICGRAFTVHYVPNGVVKGNVGDFLDDVKPGEVVVIDNGGFDNRAIFGELMAAYCKRRGIAGIVCDGAVRDSDALSRMEGFPVYACGVTPNGPYKNGPGEIGVPVVIGGKVVRPGDIIVGGISMGGYGALLTALKHPETYSNVFALSSALQLCENRPTEANTLLPYIGGTFGPLSESVESGKNPRYVFEKRKAAGESGGRPRVFMACGTEDKLITMNRFYRDFFSENGFDLTYFESPGVHNWDFWNEYLKRAVEWLP